MSRNSTHINCNQVAGTVNQGIWKNDCDPCATSPYNINNITVWHRFNYGVNNQATAANILANVANGANVTKWEDQIGTNHGIQTTVADQPTWFATDTSHAVQGGNHFDLTSGITYAAAEDFTILVSYVPLASSTPGGEIIWDKGDGTNHVKWLSATSIEVKLNNVATTVTGPAIQLANYTNFVVRRCSGTVQVFIAGIPWGVTHVNNGAVTVERLAPTGNGYIAAHMQFDRCLTDKEIWCLDCYNSNQDDEEKPVSCNVSSDKIECFGDTDGSLTATGFNMTGTITYLWAPGGQTTQTITGQGAGTYTCTLTDSASPPNVCTAIGTVVGPNDRLLCTVTGVNPQYILNSSNQQILTTGSVSVNVTGGWGAGCALSYVWTRNGAAIQNSNGGMADPGNVATFNVTMNGVYAVTVTDCEGCTTTCNVTITIPNPPSTLDIECCYEAVGCHDGDVLWAIMMDSTATFPCTITATGSVSGTASWAPITVSSLPASTSIDGSIYDMFPCESGGPWYYGATGTEIDNGETWTFTVTDSSSTPRSQTCAVTVPNPQELTLNAVVNQPTSCSDGGAQTNGNVSFNGSGGGTLCNPYTYLITGPGSFSTTNNYVMNAPAGTYTLTVTNACGCTATQTVTIICPVAVDMDVTTTLISCAPIVTEGDPNPTAPCDGTATFTATPTSVTGFTFTLNIYDNGGALIQTYGPNATFGAQTLTLLCLGNYTWDYIATNTSSGVTNISDSGVFTISAPPVLVATVTSTTSINCAGGATGAIDLTVSGGTPAYSYLWTAGSTGVVPSGQSTNQDLTGLVAGIYYCVITDSKGCIVRITQALGELTCPMTIQAYPHPISCTGQTTDLTQLYISCGTAPYTYAWVASAGGSLGGNASTVAALYNIGAGTYTVTVTDANGCTGTQAWTIAAPSSISGSITGTDVTCKGERTGAAQFDQWAQGQFSGAVYQWYTDSGYSTVYPYGASTNSYISFAPAGTYYLRVTLGNGCIWEGSIVISEPGTGMNLSAVVTDDNQCTECCGAIDLTVTGGASPYTYQWNDPAASTTQDLTCVNAGTYNVIVTDDNGCTATADYTVGIINYSLQILITVDVANGQLLSTIGGGTPPYYYQWTFNGNAFSYSANPFTAGNGIYCLTVTDDLGCTGTRCIDYNQERRTGSFNCQTYSSETGVTSYGCVSVQGSGGTYSTLSACQEVCGVERPVRFRCNEGTGCVSHPGGTFTSLSACNAVCGPTGQTDINYVCEILCNEDASGEKYKTTGGTIDRDDRGEPIRESAGEPGGRCREENSSTDGALTKYTTAELCRKACPWCKEGTYRY